MVHEDQAALLPCLFPSGFINFFTRKISSVWLKTSLLSTARRQGGCYLWSDASHLRHLRWELAIYTLAGSLKKKEVIKLSFSANWLKRCQRTWERKSPLLSGKLFVSTFIQTESRSIWVTLKGFSKHKAIHQEGHTPALGQWLSWLEHHPVHQSIVGLIPCQGIY